MEIKRNIEVHELNKFVLVFVDLNPDRANPPFLNITLQGYQVVYSKLNLFMGLRNIK